MNVREVPLVFPCEGNQLIGVAHVPASVRSRGIVFIVAGGSQYRGGMCRMQVQMAREWALQGIPVMRFDHRGLGDSEGAFTGFREVESDLRAAIAAFRAQLPDMQEVVLWGGCDGATASLINGWKFKEVTGLVLGNPWVHSEQTADQVAVRHFGQRIRDREFWLKALRGGYNPGPALATLLRALLQRLKRLWPGVASSAGRDAGAWKDDPSIHHLVRMRQGLLNFKGDVLLLMSDRSLVSKEFDELVAAYPDWQHALRSPRRVDRYDLEDADQAFSTLATRADVSRVTSHWVLGQRIEGLSAVTTAS